MAGRVGVFLLALHVDLGKGKGQGDFLFLPYSTGFTTVDFMASTGNPVSTPLTWYSLISTDYSCCQTAHTPSCCRQ